MNVSCEGILMRYVLNEKEAFAEIRRYLEVNNIVPNTITIEEVKIREENTHKYIETAKRIYVGFERDEWHARSFLIRQNSKPPFVGLSQMNDRDYYLRKPEELNEIRKEMTRYIASLHENTHGGM